jgi:hypothetical protein
MNHIRPLLFALLLAFLWMRPAAAQANDQPGGISVPRWSHRSMTRFDAVLVV